MMKRFICGAFACFIALTVVHAQSASGQRVYNPALFKALEWRSIGPYRGGRVTAVAGVPGQPLVYYMGATGGGVWKTRRCRTHVESDYRRFRQDRIGRSHRVAPSDPNGINVGMGEADIRSNFSQNRLTAAARSTWCGRRTRTIMACGSRRRKIGCG
jgi:hypothetical protein